MAGVLVGVAVKLPPHLRGAALTDQAFAFQPIEEGTDAPDLAVDGFPVPWPWPLFWFLLGWQLNYHPILVLATEPSDPGISDRGISEEGHQRVEGQDGLVEVCGVGAPWAAGTHRLGSASGGHSGRTRIRTSDLILIRDAL